MEVPADRVINGSDYPSIACMDGLLFRVLNFSPSVGQLSSRVAG